MKNQKISIIVPVFNAQNRLVKCINSLLRQTYQNIEIILVNDGSTDNSLEICSRYAYEDKRIVLINQESHGVSFTRNVGLDNATGDFIMFVDSDDFVSTTYCEDAVNNLLQYKSDVAIFGFERIEGKKKEKHLIYGNHSKRLSKEIVMDQAMIDSYTWDKIYKRELFKKIRYPLHQNYEDLSTTYQVLNNAGTISYCAKVNYYYIASSGSIVSKMSQENIADQFNAAWEFIEFLRLNYPKEYKNNISRLLVYAIRYCTYCSKNYNYDYYQKAFNLLKHEPVTSELDASHRMIMKLFKFSAPLTRMLLLIRRKINQ